MSKAEQALVPTQLHATLFLAQMLAREGNFPVKYLDGSQRLIDDTLLNISKDELSEKQRENVKAEVMEIIRQARSKAGLET